MIDGLPPTVYTAGEHRKNRIGVHTQRDCPHIDNTHVREITVYATGALTVGGSTQLPAEYMWCSTCAYEPLFGPGSATHQALEDANPEDLPP